MSKVLGSLSATSPVPHHQGLLAPNKPVGPRPLAAAAHAPQAARAAGHGRRVAVVARSSQSLEVASLQDEEGAEKFLSQQYNRQMKDAMGWSSRPYEYDYSRGLYYHEIIPGLFCGSQPRHANDVEELKRDLQLTSIVSLQQDKDMHYWGVNPDEIRHRCAQLGIDLIRKPVRDFDPHSLRKVLPSAVQSLHETLDAGGRVYVHCTAGLGRAPGVIIAYLYWFHDLDLDTAYEMLTSIRPCGPKKEAIRGATHDLMSGKPMDSFDQLPKDAFAKLSPSDKYALQWQVLKR